MNALLKQYETRIMPVRIRNTNDSLIGHFIMAFIVMRPLDKWLSGIYNVILYYAYPTVMVIKQMKSQNGSLTRDIAHHGLFPFLNTFFGDAWGLLYIRVCDHPLPESGETMMGITVFVEGL
mgnify:FL=1